MAKSHLAIALIHSFVENTAYSVKCLELGSLSREFRTMTLCTHTYVARPLALVMVLIFFLERSWCPTKLLPSLLGMSFMHNKKCIILKIAIAFSCLRNIQRP